MRWMVMLALAFSCYARADEKAPASLEGWFAYRYKGNAFGKCSAIDAKEAATLKASYKCEVGGRVNGARGSARRTGTSGPTRRARSGCPRPSSRPTRGR